MPRRVLPFSYMDFLKVRRETNISWSGIWPKNDTVDSEFDSTWHPPADSKVLAWTRCYAIPEHVGKGNDQYILKLHYPRTISVKPQTHLALKSTVAAIILPLDTKTGHRVSRIDGTWSFLSEWPLTGFLIKTYPDLPLASPFPTFNGQTFKTIMSF